jgi:ABC-type dipeptide/oligopeptide/nickel transport systems, permease components
VTWGCRSSPGLPVAAQLGDATVVSLILTATAMGLAALIGVPAGVYAARRPRAPGTGP